LSLGSSCPVGGILIVPVSVISGINSPRVSHEEKPVCHCASSVLDGISSDQGIGMTTGEMVPVVVIDTVGGADCSSQNVLG
jgi:hypothetical protein